MNIECPVTAIVSELIAIQSRMAEPHCEVRLAIHRNGHFTVNYGDVGYDLEHTGACGAATISRVAGRKTLAGVAKEMWNEAVDMSVDVAADFPSLCYAR